MQGWDERNIDYNRESRRGLKMEQNRNFKIGIERPDGTIEEWCDIGEIKEIELTAEVDQVDGIDYFKDTTFTFDVTDNFNRIGRIFNVLNNVRKYRGIPMKRVKAFKKSHKLRSRCSRIKTQQ